MWPAVIVQQLFPMLPAGYIAAPRVHLGTAFEIDVSTFERNEPAHQDRPSDGSSGVAVRSLPQAISGDILHGDFAVSNFVFCVRSARLLRDLSICDVGWCARQPHDFRQIVGQLRQSLRTSPRNWQPG
jgi:hypothetical protein